jgi:beta-mannosidase
MAAVFGEWRRAGSPCTGGLVLWLRDLMPGAGWGVVDHAGAAKVAWHHLRRALAPAAVWMTDEGLGGVGVHVANDGPEPLAATLRIGLYRGEQRVGEVERELDLGRHEDAGFDLEALLGRFADASWAYRFGPSAQDAIFAGIERDGDLLSQSVFLPAGRPRELESAERLGLEVEARTETHGAFVRLRSERLVYGLRLAATGFDCDDDAFSLEPGVERIVRLAPRPGSAGGGQVRLRALNMLGGLAVPLGEGS